MKQWPTRPLAATRVLLLLGDERVAGSLAGRLSAYGMEVTTCSSPGEALDALQVRRHHVAVCTLEGDPIGAVELKLTAANLGFDLPVVAITAGPSVTRVVEALNAGVSRLIVEPFEIEDLETLVLDVLVPPPKLPPPVAHRIDELITALPITRREREILELVLEGLGNRAIAHRLGISESAVSRHLSNIYQRLRVSGRSQLFRLVLEALG